MSTGDPLLVQLLTAAVSSGASDIHLSVGRKPTVRIDGQLAEFENVPVLSDQDTARMVMSTLDEGLQKRLLEERQLDYPFEVLGVARFRTNAYFQKGHLSVAFRTIPVRIPTLADLGAPDILKSLTRMPYGLVLVVGPTGSGKSTTLAAMIDHINRERPVHILTIEDPVEYLHGHQVAMVNQREVGTDAPTFEMGLKAALREDPDVVLMGEMRDMESISIGLTLAETGHLVFATLHTNDAAQTFDRLIDVFPAEKQEQIRTVLAGTFGAVVSQRLVRGVNGGRVAAYEILTGSDSTKNLIREGKTRQIRNVIATSSADGMQTLEADLARLVVAGLITLDTAREASVLPGEVMTLMDTEQVRVAAQRTKDMGQRSSRGMVGVDAGG